MMNITLPVFRTRHYDVAVIGGGTTGVCAALASARAGCKTILVEKNAFLGGNATTGLPWLGFHGYRGERLIGGIPYEWIKALQAEGEATPFAKDPICRSAVGVSAPALKLLIHRQIQENHVELLLHSIAIAVEKEANRLQTVYLANKQGIEAVCADVFIDATDSGDVASFSGVSMHLGRDKDGSVQVSSTVLRIGQVHISEMIDYFTDHPDQLRPFPLSSQQKDQLIRQMHNGCLFIIGAFPDLVAKAQAEGLPYQRDRVIGSANPLTGELVLVNSRVEHVNMNDADNLTNAENEGLRQTKATMDLLHQYIPGCQDARIVSIGHQIGVRETRHMKGVYRLTAKDLMSGTQFQDGIVQGAYHLDIHSPDHRGLETSSPPVFSIPYRCLVPDQAEGLLVAGRALCADQGAQAAIRVMPISSAIGQAAGCAAAVMIHDHTELRSLAISHLRAEMKCQGMLLPNETGEEPEL